MANTYYSAGIDLNLKDGVTPVLDKIDQRLNNLENSFKSLEDKGTSAGDNTGASLEAMGVKTVAVGVLAEKAFEQVVTPLNTKGLQFTGMLSEQDGKLQEALN